MISFIPQRRSLEPVPLGTARRLVQPVGRKERLRQGRGKILPRREPSLSPGVKAEEAQKELASYAKKIKAEGSTEAGTP